MNGGELKPGAVLQLWETQDEYKKAVGGIGANGHSVIFMGYGTVNEAIPVTNFNVIIYADQSGGGKILDRSRYQVVFGANLIDKE